MKIQHVIFDVGNVLVRWAQFIFHYRQCKKNHRISQSSFPIPKIF